MEYKFTQKVTKEDYIAFVTNHMKISFLKPVNIILFTVSIGYLMVSPFIIDEKDYTFLFIGVGIVLLLFAMILFARKNAAKQYDKSEEQFNMTYIVDDEKLIYMINEGNVEKQWIDFYSTVETEEYIYIYVNKNSGMVLVKRDIPTNVLSFVREKLKTHVDARKVKLLS